MEELPKKPPAQDDATGRVLRLVYGSHRPEPHAASHPPHEEDEEVEVDERWLMTYADKMTILCGLFIMLFAMSTMTKAKLERVKESTQKSFGKPTAEKEGKAIEVEDIGMVKAQLKQSQDHGTEIQNKLQDSLTKIQALEAQVKQLTESSQTAAATTAELQRLREENSRLTEQVKQATPEPVTEPTEKIPDTRQQVKRLEKENVTLKRTLATIQEQVKQDQAQIGDLQEQLAKSKSASPNSAFVAFMMKWSTNDQDVDLKVTDPTGKRFDFKHRKYSGHPGVFVLDTRRGPGMELWQADKIIPGTYQITYQFYNEYGNNSPCPVTGTLFSPKGSIDLPTVTLNTGGKREASFRIQVDENGNAQVQ